MHLFVFLLQVQRKVGLVYEGGNIGFMGTITTTIHFNDGKIF